MNKKYPNLADTTVITPSNMDEYPTIVEAVHSYRVCDLGSPGVPGMLALSLAAYVRSVRERLLEGEQLPPNAFIQMGYSQRSMAGWIKQKQLHASGGTNIPVMALAVPDTDNSSALVLDIENSVRETVAQLNEQNEEKIRTVHLTVEETTEEVDPMTAFECPPELMSGSRIEKEVTLSL